eukprot:scaffold2420_cov259-Pinguiococcus_pyrenoidosus.AAC.1
MITSSTFDPVYASIRWLRSSQSNSKPRSRSVPGRHKATESAMADIWSSLGADVEDLPSKTLLIGSCVTCALATLVMLVLMLKIFSEPRPRAAVSRPLRPAAPPGPRVLDPLAVRSSEGFGTTLIHAGQEPDRQTGAVVPPISLATTFAQ